MKKLLLAAGILAVSMTAFVSVYAQENDETILSVSEEENPIQEEDDALREELLRDETDDENEADEITEEDEKSEETVSTDAAPPSKGEAEENTTALEEETEVKEDAAALKPEEELINAQAADAQSLRSGWVQKNGNTYFYENGSKLTGWQNINGRVFYFLQTGDDQRKGKMLKGFQSIGGRTYYFKQTGASGVKGALFTGIQKINGQTYMFRDTGDYGDFGEMLTGFQEYNGNTYYLKQTGAAGTKGKMFTGFQTIGGKTYYFKQTGTRGVKGMMFTGFKKIGGKFFYFVPEGEIGTRGVMLIGWRNIGGETYYFKQSGAPGVRGYMFTGTCTISGVKYKFASDGRLTSLAAAAPKIYAWKKTADSTGSSAGGDGVEYTVSWSKVSGAAGYQVCFSSRDIDEELNGEPWHISYITTGQTLYKTQFSSYPTHIKAKVRVFRQVGQKTVYGPWSSEVSKKCEWTTETASAKSAYKEFLSQKQIKWYDQYYSTDILKFAAADFNNDGVEELYIYNPKAFSYQCNYRIYKYRNNQVGEIYTFGTGPAMEKYYPLKGVFVDVGGRMSEYYTKYVYMDKNGNCQTKLCENKTVTSTTSYEYFLGDDTGTKISKSQFQKKKSDLLGTASAKTVNLVNNTSANRNKYLG